MEKALEEGFKNFLANIRWLRKYHGYSKKQMATILKIGITSLNKIENGELPQKMSSTIISNIESYFGIPADKQFELKLSEPIYDKYRKVCSKK